MALKQHYLQEQDGKTRRANYSDRGNTTLSVGTTRNLDFYPKPIASLKSLESLNLGKKILL